MNLNWLIEQDRKLHSLIERKVEAADGGSGVRGRLFSAYLRSRYRAMRWGIRRGKWHPSELNVALSLFLNDGDVFLDIGANVGWVTTPASYLVGEKGKVYCFEPSPTTIRYLRRRVEYLGLRNVTVNQFGLGGEPGEAVLHEFDENFGGASSLRPGAWPGHQQARETAVPIKVLDTYLEQEKAGPVRLIKMDVQGAEIDVLRGARRLLTSDAPPVLCVELEEVAQAAFGRSVPELMAAITELGYEMHSWREDGLIPVKTIADVLPGGHDDVICFKPGRHDAFYAAAARLAERCPGKTAARA